MSTALDYTRSSFKTVAAVWVPTDGYVPEVGSFTCWRQGKLCGTSTIGATLLGITLSTQVVVTSPKCTEVNIVMAGAVWTAMMDASQDWRRYGPADMRQHYIRDGVLMVLEQETIKSRPVAGVTPLENPSPDNPYCLVELSCYETAPQDFLDGRCGIQIAPPDPQDSWIGPAFGSEGPCWAGSSAQG